VHFADSDDFLLSSDAFGFRAYVVESLQRGVPGMDLLRLVRKRSDAPLLLLSDDPDHEFVTGLGHGADMVLATPTPMAHLAAAVAAVERRRDRAKTQSGAWRLDAARMLLLSPDGTPISLTATDLVILQTIAEAADRRVPRELLMQRLWDTVSTDMDNALHATVYRLRKRIEKTGQLMSPLQALPRVGYEFRAPLQTA
jgi:DNA-binding response OmpR family regulator